MFCAWEWTVSTRDAASLLNWYRCANFLLPYACCPMRLWLLWPEGCFTDRTERAGGLGLGLGGLQTVSKQSGRSFLHPAAAAVAMAVGPQPIIQSAGGQPRVLVGARSALAPRSVGLALPIDII